MIMNFKRFITFLFCALVCFATVSQAREKSVVIGVSASKPSSATETYIKAKTMYILVNKNSIPKAIRTKLGIK